jgi:hypothetical protein
MILEKIYSANSRHFAVEWKNVSAGINIKPSHLADAFTRTSSAVSRRFIGTSNFNDV